MINMLQVFPFLPSPLNLSKGDGNLPRVRLSLVFVVYAKLMAAWYSCCEFFWGKVMYNECIKDPFEMQVSADCAEAIRL